jgi:hypothetical protein
MSERTKILLQTTIPYTEDDWNIGRFSMLTEHLVSLTDENGEKLYEVVSRDRETDESGNDVILQRLDETDVDELWLFAVDTGNGLSGNDCHGITRFRQRGGGIFSARDHQDLGISLCSLGGIGAAHYFHSKNPDPDVSRRLRDDPDNKAIDHPNFHSGSNGDFQRINPVGDLHELLRRESGGPIEYFPAHPHEGAVGAVPDDSSSRVIATGTSTATGRKFNLMVAFERSRDRHGNDLGRAIAESSFHHLVDYNWDTDAGCPTFLTESPGRGFKEHPEVINDVKRYAANVAAWLNV